MLVPRMLEQLVVQFLSSDRAIYGFFHVPPAVAALTLSWDLFDRSSLGGRLIHGRKNRRLVRRRKRRARGL